MLDLREYIEMLAGLGAPQGLGPRWLLQNGQHFPKRVAGPKEKLYVRRRVAKYLDKYPGSLRKGNCFRNSQLFMLLGDLSQRLRYCEGYAYAGVPLPTHHAWLVINESVVDLTWWSSEPIIGTWDDQRDYFGAIFDLSSVKDFVLENTRHASLLDHLIRKIMPH